MTPTPQQMTCDILSRVMPEVPVFSGDMVIVWPRTEKQRRFDPFTGRDDLAEVLAKLTDEQWRKISVILVDQTKIGDSLIRHVLTASPSQVTIAVWSAVCQ